MSCFGRCVALLSRVSRLFSVCVCRLLSVPRNDHAQRSSVFFPSVYNLLTTQIVRLQAQVDESECKIEDLRRLLAEAQNDAAVSQDIIWRSAS